MLLSLLNPVLVRYVIKFVEADDSRLSTGAVLAVALLLQVWLFWCLI